MVSLLGSELSGFALGLWLLQRTGSVTTFGMAMAALVAPFVLVSPFAGVLVDRWNRRTVLMAADLGGLLRAAGLGWVLLGGELGVASILMATAIGSVLNALRLPALAAATTTLVPPAHLARANGMFQLSQAVAQVGAPLLGILALAKIGVRGVVAVDGLTFAVALATLVTIRVPDHRAPAEDGDHRGRLRAELLGGWRFIADHPELAGLLALAFNLNFALGCMQVLAPPLVLGFATAVELGVVLTIGGVGMIAGSCLLIAWGGPPHKMAGLLGFAAVESACLLAVGLVPTTSYVALMAFGFLFAAPLVAGCSQAIWQAKTPQDLQGRVFTLRFAFTQASMPLAYLVVGPLADRWAEPALRPGGAMADTAGRLLGTGPGRGSALLLTLLGLYMALVLLAAACSSRLNGVEAGACGAGISPTRQK